MNNNLSYLYNLQESCAIMTGLTIMICNRDGELQADISWESRQSEEQFEKYVTKDALGRFLNEFHEITHTILLNTKFGVKIIISPIKTIGQRTNYFIIAGVTVQRQTDESIANYFEFSQVFDLMHKTQDFTEKTIRKKVEQITNLSETISSYMTMLEENKLVKEFLKLFSEKLVEINNGAGTAESILELGTFFEDIDFMGVAIPVQKDRYGVETVIGDYSKLQIGYEFDIGEGVLGYSVATKRPLFYEDITDDARRNVFLDRQMNVVSLFCFPLIVNRDVIGVLYGGSSKYQVRKTSFLYDSLSSCATILSTHLVKMKIRSTNRKLQIQSEMQSELLSAYPTARNLEKTLHLIIDIGMNTMNFEFISIVYLKRTKAERIEVISRGLAEEEIQDYCSQLAKKSVVSKIDHLIANGAKLNTTSWGVAVVEIPITLSGISYGTLSVGLKSKGDMELFGDAISSLATAAGIALHFLIEEKNKYTKEVNLEWIQVILQNFKPKKYKFAEQIRNCALLFLRENSEVDLSHINTIALVAVSNQNTMSNLVKDVELRELMNDYYDVLNNKSKGDYLMESIAVIWTYYANDETIDSVFELELVHNGIKEQFCSFLKKQKMSQQTMKLGDVDERPLQSKDFGLTKREEEVLYEMMQGFGNKEIGANLFISEHTVKNHITSILGKLGVADRSQAIAKVYQMGYKI